ncbi:glycosyltransferase [bacterium]|nr:glycosyltransferase [bacterium]
MRIAIVHDWLTNLGGAERVVAAMLEAYPQADLYTSVYNPERLKLFRDKRVHTTFLQNIPLAKQKHQLFSGMRRLAFEQLDIKGYDVVISSTTAEAKGIITDERTLHISYINTPTRYLWSHYAEYLAHPGFGVLDPLARWQLRRTVQKARKWDFAAAQRPDVLLANSKHVQKRIQKYYQRDSQVVYPVVDVERFMKRRHPRPRHVPDRYMLAVSRLVPYKRIDIAVQACEQAGYPLIVIGAGPQLKSLRKIAGPQTQFLGEVKDSLVEAYLQHASAFLFPGEEDFGITPVESLASGTPVIAYRRGGATETVADSVGVLVRQQSVAAFVRAIQEYDATCYDADILQLRAQEFSRERFIAELQRVVRASLESVG